MWRKGLPSEHLITYALLNKSIHEEGGTGDKIPKKTKKKTQFIDNPLPNFIVMWEGG